MAIIRILNSGSVANCYIIETKNQKLILECGSPFKDILNALSFDFQNVVGCLITHEHKDHSASSKRLSEHTTIFASEGTISSINVHTNRCEILKPRNLIQIGEFKVLPFKVFHPAREPLNFLINHREFGNLLFVTDTYKLDVSFKNISHTIFEANYSEEIVENQESNPYLKRLITAHMSIENAHFYINAFKEGLQSITLCHLSDKNSHKEKFKSDTQKRFGIRTHIAEKNTIINLNF